MKRSSQILMLCILQHVSGFGVEAKMYRRETLELRQPSLPQNKELWTWTEIHSMENNQTGGQFANYESGEGCTYIDNNIFNISWDVIIWGLYFILVAFYFGCICCGDICTPYREILVVCISVYLNSHFFEWLSSEMQYHRNKHNVTCHF
ncbi:unnamed protein product [Allacma fusca]|uniref:Uncharacterized protein n=1 Tax=Allacma fusca TaxID=39272 RepID=A0A8J2JD69_9HEXA|nr:unnamed protein product [Allacma fusca]